MKLESLDLAIGMVVVFLLVSTLCSALREAIEAVLKTRAAYLERAIREMLDDKNGKGLTESLFDHPLFAGLFLGKYRPKPEQKKLWVLANGRGLPSYVPSVTFAKALLDIAGRGASIGEPSQLSGAPITVESLRARLLDPQNHMSERVRRVLLHALDTARGDLEQARKNLEDWFNDSMDRVSGWYKRSTQWMVFVIAVVVTVTGNVDSIDIAKHFYRDEAARNAAVASAQTIVADSKAPTNEEAREVLEQLELPVGWSKTKLPEDSEEWFNRVLGWLLTAFAATLGAPFWFDVLNKVMVIRSTVKPREKSPDEASEDRQAPAASVTPTPRGAAGPVATPAPALPATEQDELDCCGGPLAEPTEDEQLPAASGGVQT